MAAELKNIDQVFWDALQIEGAAEREAFLARACGDDEQLRQMIQKLIQAQPRAEQFLEQPFRLGAATELPAVTEQPGTVIGPYKLLEQIGEGGFGVVFLAEQDRPVKRRVALKVVKPGMDTREVIARFEAERQALAMMDHPNIAKVYDAGTTGENGVRNLLPERPEGDFVQKVPDTFFTGRPYFVMELVHGVPITEYCDQCNLTTRERLELFITVCQAVQHAHQKGIIHRDIKPTNVLVAWGLAPFAESAQQKVPVPFTLAPFAESAQQNMPVPLPHNEKPLVKIIDFGVAKAINQQLTERTLMTAYAQIIGTPLYMSPEQAKLNQLDIDTRSDIYSLGVLLYELLTGTTPFERKRLQEAAFDEMLRIIREEEPPKPSTKLSSSDTLPSIAANRHTEPARLSKDVHGDLDWIVMKCLEKDRARRYDSAANFAADIERHLNDQPVDAGPPSAVYRFRKFARRNKAALTAASVVAAALLLGSIGTTWQAVRATDAERVARAQRDRALEAEQKAKVESERASQEAAIATAVNEFLSIDLLAQADPRYEPDREIKLRLVLDRAAAKIETRFPDQPLVEAAVRTTLGRTYFLLGEWTEAETHLKRARELHRREFGEEHPKTLTSTAWLARLYTSVGNAEGKPQKLEEGRKLLEENLDIQRRTQGEEHPNTLSAVDNLAVAFDLQERPAEGLALMEPMLPLVHRIWGEEDPRTLSWMNNQANMLRKLDRGNEALQLYQQALDISRRVRGNEHPSTLLLEDNIAVSLNRMGRMDEAVKHHVPVVDARRRVLGEGHTQTSWSITELQSDIRGLASAQKGVVRAIELVQGIIQSTPQSGAAWTALGMAQYKAGDWRAAIDAFEKSMEIRNGHSAIDWFLLSMAHAQLGNADTARKWYDQAGQLMDKNQLNDVYVRKFRTQAEELLKIAEQKKASKSETK